MWGISIVEIVGVLEKVFWGYNIEIWFLRFNRSLLGREVNKRVEVV